MQVTTFPFESLPCLRRDELTLLRSLRVALGTEREAAFARWAARMGLPDGEQAWLEPCLLPAASTTWRSGWPAGVALRWVLHGPGGRRAWLGLDAALAASLIALLLRSQPSPLCTPPSTGERGVATYAVAALLQELGPLGWTVALEEPGEQPSGACVEAHLRLGQRGGGLAWLRLDEKNSSVTVAPVSEPPRHWRRLALSWRVPVEVARLQLPFEELPSLGAGDVIMFAGCPAPGGELIALVRVGAGGYPARVGELGVRIEGPFRMGGLAMIQPEARQLVAEQLQLEVVVELGRAHLTAAQLLELEVGDVITLEHPLDAPLELRVGDKLVARGELVNVEGEAGVRLTQIFE